MKKMFLGLSLLVFLASCGSEQAEVEVPVTDSTVTLVDTFSTSSVDTALVVADTAVVVE